MRFDGQEKKEEGEEEVAKGRGQGSLKGLWPPIFGGLENG